MKACALVIALFSLHTACSLKVLVTGATGKTGSRVFKQLMQSPDHDPFGLVRNEAKGRALVKKTEGADMTRIRVADVADPDADLQGAMMGCDALVVCTSAVPIIKKRTLAKLLAKKLLRYKDVGRPEFRWGGGDKGCPEEVDYFGQMRQFDAAVSVGVKKIILVSSMGGTQPENFLNTIGKDKDGNGNGDILLWKRKAEKYLTGLPVLSSIIHPGGLVDKNMSLKRKLILGVDDKLLERKQRSIARDDVASLCIKCLELDKSVSLDVISEETDEGVEGCDIEGPLREFLEMGKVCAYAE